MDLRNVLKTLLGVSRELTQDQFFTQLYGALETRSEFTYPYILEYMRSGDGDYIVVTDNGKLYRMSVGVTDDTVVLGDPVEVQVQYVEVPASRSRAFVRRDANGVLKFYGIASSAVLNRVGEIDSTKFFDHIEENYENQEEPAYMTFLHLGETFRFGEVKKVFRYEKFLIIAGDVDESTVIGSRIAEQLGENPDNEWGISIGFRATEEPERVRIGGTEILVFNRGTLIECSILKENSAASYFTTIASVRSENMGFTREKAKEALLEFLGADAESDVEGLLDEANVRNRKIEDEGMITREAEEEVQEPVEEVAEEEVSLEITEEIIDAIALKVAEKINFPAFDDSQLVAELEAARSRLEELTKRLEEVERADTEKVQEAALSLSSAVRSRNVKVVYKQVTEVEDEPVAEKDDSEMSLRDRAKANLEKHKIKKG